MKRDPLLSRLVALAGGPCAARSSALFSVRGSAFYSLQSCANHSCAPTARAVPGAWTRGLSPSSLAAALSRLRRSPSSSSRSSHPSPPEGSLPCSALLVAAVDLAPGDEVTICYVDERGSKEERAKGLRDYGISECDCRRCLGKEDETEEEEGRKEGEPYAAAAAAAASHAPLSGRRTREGGEEADEEAGGRVEAGSEVKRARTDDGERKMDEEKDAEEKEKPPPPPPSSTATPWLGAWRAL